ncbi:MAG: DNA recombination protein RmuC [Deltaproteobacteria bacterium]
MLFAVLFLILTVVLIAMVLKISSQMSQRLDRMNQMFLDANKNISLEIGGAASIFGNVKESLGRLEASNRQIYEIGKDIAGLQELLRAPKLRGQLGEMFLENLLAQVMPKDYYEIQYKFRTGDAVDAVIRLGGGLVPVDAKFSLENFKKMLETQDEGEKSALRKLFIRDIKNRIDEIASKYILPDENTYDFALMYIPAENVYYEVIIKEDMLAFCLSKKVIPVSPNTFYAYLQVICLGLKGLKIEQNAQEILKNLAALSTEMNKFKEDFELTGSHLVNACKKYDDSTRRLGRFSDKLQNLQNIRQIESDKP